MAGAVIENVSSKKLYIGSSVIFLLSVGGFLLGGLYVTSQPNIASTNIATECIVDHEYGTDHAYMPWHPSDAPKLPNQACNNAEGKKHHLTTNDIIHALHIPKKSESLSRWWSYLLVLVYPNLEFVKQDEYGFGKPNDTKMHFDAKIFYRDDLSAPWNLSYRATFSRNFVCEENNEFETTQYNCDPMHFVELGSVPHKYYLINFKLPIVDLEENPINRRIGKIEHMNMPVIFQSPDFTKVWLGLQTAVFLTQWFSLSWFANRLWRLDRPKTLIEKSIVSLGGGIQIANFPIQWAVLVTDASWMLLFSDIRQGFAYFMLFTFWLIFMSEHLLDRPHRNNLRNYRWQLALVTICALSMFLFDCIERGIQLKSPFWSVWDTQHGRNAAIAMPIVGGICGGIYTLYLIFIVARVSFNLIKRREHFVGRLHAEGLIIRFQAIICFTVFCAIFSVVLFFYHEATDAPTMINGYHVQVQSAMYTGLYVLWNLYVLSVMVLYAPSHKHYYGSTSEMAPLHSEVSSISASRADSIHQTLPQETSTAELLAPLTASRETKND